jgi:hypothetical protein
LNNKWSTILKNRQQWRFFLWHAGTYRRAIGCIFGFAALHQRMPPPSLIQFYPKNVFEINHIKECKIFLSLMSACK